MPIERIMTSAFLLIPFFACNAASNSPSPTELPVDAVTAPSVEEAVSTTPSGVKTTGDLPGGIEPEQTHEDAVRQACIDDCIQARQMEAVAIEMIEESCKQGCMGNRPLLQLEPASAP